MKKLWKKIGTMWGIKNTSLTFPHQEIYFELLKSKVSPTQKLMVAVSGGADSILTACLVYNFFLKYKYNLQNLFFIHCNHNTRVGNLADQEFITTFFEGTQTIIVKRQSTKNSKNKNNEAELRKRRYEAFKKQTKKHNIDQLIFGHNLTDRIESTFLNLLRGANLNGFVAMQEQETHHLLPNIQILRPILWLTKDEITQICKQNKVPFITDPTNADTTTSLRNKLRNNVLPEIYKLANKQTKTTNSFIESMKNIYRQLEHTSKEKNISLKNIPQSPHRNATFAYQRIIHTQDITNENILQIMKQLHISNNITTPLLNEISDFLRVKTSGYKYANTTYFFKAHENIYIISAPKLFREKTIDSSKKITTLGKIIRGKTNYTIDKKEYIGATIRYAKTGDKYKKKTRNKWCINEKIPIFRRKFTPILVKKNQIIKIFK